MDCHGFTVSPISSPMAWVPTPGNPPRQKANAQRKLAESPAPHRCPSMISSSGWLVGCPAKDRDISACLIYSPGSPSDKRQSYCTHLLKTWTCRDFHIAMAGPQQISSKSLTAAGKHRTHEIGKSSETRPAAPTDFCCLVQQNAVVGKNGPAAV